MSSSHQRLAANRANAILSTGPVTARGKDRVSRNAIRHGVLSRRTVLDDEDPFEFESLMAELTLSLAPVGVVEAALVERIGLAMWRQRRLVRAETAAISLARQPTAVAKQVTAVVGRPDSKAIVADDLVPFDGELSEWCRRVLAEIGNLQIRDLETLERQAPLAFAQLQRDAAGEVPETYLAGHRGGLVSYLVELMLWCRNSQEQAEERPRILALARQVQEARLILSGETLEVLARYQTTLDSQLYRALKALREAQEWRLRTLVGVSSVSDDAEAGSREEAQTA